MIRTLNEENICEDAGVDWQTPPSVTSPSFISGWKIVSMSRSRRPICSFNHHTNSKTHEPFPI